MYNLVRVCPLDWQTGDRRWEYRNVSCYGEDEATFFFVYKNRVVTFNKAAVLGWSVE